MRVLRGIGKIDGDGWKDTTQKGEAVFVHATPLPAPYILSGGGRQFERVGNIGWTASERQYRFEPASLFQTIRLIPSLIGDWFERRKHYRFRRAA